MHKIIEKLLLPSFVFLTICNFSKLKCEVYVKMDTKKLAVDEISLQRLIGAQPRFLNSFNTHTHAHAQILTLKNLENRN